MNNVFGENKNYFQPVTDWTKVYVEWQDADLVRQAGKRHKCSASVSHSGSWHSSLCSKTAKYTRLVNQYDQPAGRFGFNDTDTIGYKHFCGMHDPVAQKEKRQARWDEETRYRNAQNAREDARQRRAALVQAAVGHLTDGQLVKLANMKLELDVMLSS